MHAVKQARHPGLTEMELTELRAPRRPHHTMRLDWTRISVYVGLFVLCVEFWYVVYALIAR